MLPSSSGSSIIQVSGSVRRRRSVIVGSSSGKHQLKFHPRVRAYPIRARALHNKAHGWVQKQTTSLIKCLDCVPPRVHIGPGRFLSSEFLINDKISRGAVFARCWLGDARSRIAFHGQCIRFYKACTLPPRCRQPTTTGIFT